MEPESSDILALAPFLADRLVPDDRFAAAYDAVSEADRARLKLCIARLHALYAPQQVSRSRTVRVFDQGFACATSESPLAFAVVLAGQEAVSPAKLLAACVPALCAGVRQVLAVLPPEPGDALLAALELAGVEDALVLGGGAEELLPHLAKISEPGMLLSLASPLAGCDDWPHARWSPSARECGPARFGIALPENSETGQQIAHQLELLHPECRLGWEVDPSGPFAGWDVLVAEDVAEAAGCALVTDPVHAGVWVWPRLTPELFRTRRIALAARERP